MGRETAMTEIAPPGRPKRAPRLTSWLLVLLTLLAVVGAWFALQSGFRWGPGGAHWAAAMPKDEFERRVRAYLLEHPEVIAEAVSRLESQQGAQEATEVQSVLKSRAEEVFRDPDSPMGGNPNGDVTLVEFFDYNCPYCRQMAPLMHDAAEADSRLWIVYKEFPILGPNSTFAARAALAAHRQGKYLAFHDMLMKARGVTDETKVLEIAATVGIDLNRMKADMQAPAIQALLDRNLDLARALRINGTPGFVVGDKVFAGAVDLKVLQNLVSDARNGRSTAGR
jgi:protein-disulfide isomerase